MMLVVGCLVAMVTHYFELVVRMVLVIVFQGQSGPVGPHSDNNVLVDSGEPMVTFDLIRGMIMMIKVYRSSTQICRSYRMCSEIFVFLAPTVQ